jgi:hypothetical protein
MSGEDEGALVSVNSLLVKTPLDALPTTFFFKKELT